MKKKLTYPAFIIAAFLVVLTFITATTYVQLGIAVALYIPLAWFALKIFQRKENEPMVTVPLPSVRQTHAPKAKGVKTEQVEIADIDKRAFLKLLGATGLSFFIFSILGRRAESFLFGGGTQTALAPSTTVGTGVPSTTPLMEGYRIAEIDDNAITYYGFINTTGGWLIMREETETSSFRYAKGDINFPSNWTRRGSLKYDYFYKLF